MRIAPLVGKAQQAVALTTARQNLYEGSVRSGKTVASLLAWLRCLREGPPGAGLLAGKTERTARRNIINPLIEMLGAQRCRYNAGTGELTLLNRLIYVVGANDERAQDKVRGLTLASAYLDEISTLPESFYAMTLTRLSIDGSRLIGSSNPEGPRHWLKINYLDRARLHLTRDGEMVHVDEANEPLDLHRFSFQLADNPSLSSAYVQSLHREFRGLWFLRLVRGEWVAADGAIYDMFDPARHVVDILPQITRWLALGVDVGTTNPFHAVLVGVGTDNRLYVAAEFRYDSRITRRAKTDGEYSHDLRAWLDRIPIPHARPPIYGVRPQWTCVDPSAASFVAQLYRDGLTPTPAKNAVLDGIRQVAMLLSADRLRIHRSCTALLEEIPSYVWDPKRTEAGQDAPLKVDDHGADSLRYALHTTEAAWRPLLRKPLPTMQGIAA